MKNMLIQGNDYPERYKTVIGFDARLANVDGWWGFI